MSERYRGRGSISRKTFFSSGSRSKRKSLRSTREAADLARHEATPGRSLGDRARKYKVGERVRGTVTRVTDFGAFVELEPGIEGLIHISEMSWSKRCELPAMW